MISDNWYILIGDSHTGPFARGQVLQKIQKKEINQNTYLWTDGMAEWKPASDINDWNNHWSGLNLEDDLPPPLPPLNEEPDNDWQEVVLPTGSSVSLGPSERDFFERASVNISEKSAPVESWEKESEISQGTKMPWGLVTFAALFFSLTIYLLYPRYQLQDLDVQGISQTDYSKFLEMSKNSSGYQFAAHLATSIDGERIWLGVNKSGPLFLRLRLKSLPGKVLPAGDVDILSEFQTEKFATMVTNYKIIKGSQLSSGYYQVQIDGQGIGIFSKLMMQLKNLPLFSLLPFVEQYQKDFTYQGTFYLGALSESNFIIRLSEYQKEKKVLEQKPVVELLEFYRTFEALYQKLDELYGNILGQIHSGSEMRLFEKEYVVALAPIYQSMMMELSEKKARKVEGQTYDEIQFIAREFGLLVSDLLGDTRKINNLDQNTKSRLRAKFAPRIKKYRDLCNEQLKILQGYIQ